MPGTEARGLLDTLAKEGVRRVVLGGGEPLLWAPGAAKLSAYARRQGFLVQIGTNATLVPVDDRRLHDFDRWILPIESLDAAVHDGMRPFEGGHLHLVTALMARLAREGIELTISSLVTLENFDQLLELGRLLQWYQGQGGRLHAWHLYRFLPQGRGGLQHAARFGLEAQAFDSVGELLKDRFDALPILLRPDMYHSKVTSFYWWQKGALKTLPAASRALA